MVTMKRVPLSVALCVSLIPAGGVAALAQYSSLSEHSAIAYSKTAPTDAVARLQASIERGETVLEFDEAHGYLPALLRALDVPVSSQSLVFSRTSLQVDRIAPWSPRALYFNDHIYVGWVQNGPIMEIASVDPKLGAVFYSVTQTASDKPVITRETRTCLQCHDSASSTGGVPGFIMRSTIADRHGYPVHSELGTTTDQTKLADRWGGWYVTGSVPAPHLGNAMTAALSVEMGNVQSYLAKNKLGTSGTVSDLAGRFDTDPYLAKSSDAVALLVLAHQTYVHNLITAAGYQARSSPDDRVRVEGPLNAWLTHCCSSAVPSCQARLSAGRRLPPNLRNMPSPGSPRPLVARPAAESAAVQVSGQLSDLFGELRCAARAREGLRLSSSPRGAGRT